MVKVSELMIANPQIDKFSDLRELVIEVGRSGEVFLEFDVKPDYQDTPSNWHLELETAFYWGDRARELKQKMSGDDGGQGGGQ